MIPGWPRWARGVETLCVQEQNRRAGRLGRLMEQAIRRFLPPGIMKHLVTDGRWPLGHVNLFAAPLSTTPVLAVVTPPAPVIRRVPRRERIPRAVLVLNREDPDRASASSAFRPKDPRFMRRRYGQKGEDLRPRHNKGWEKDVAKRMAERFAKGKRAGR